MLKIIIGILAAAAAIFITSEDVDIKETNEGPIVIQNEELKIPEIEYKKVSKPLPSPTNTVTNSDNLYNLLVKAKKGDVIYIPREINNPRLLKVILLSST